MPLVPFAVAQPTNGAACSSTLKPWDILSVGGVDPQLPDPPPPFPGLGPYCQSPHVAMLWPDMAIGAEGAGSKTLSTAAYHTNGNDACPHGHMAHTDHLSAHTEGYKYTMLLRTLQSRMLQQHLGIPQGMIQGVQGAHVGATAALPFVWFVGLSLSKDYQRQMLPKKTPNPKKINKKLRLFW